jgi:hypothetical protein
MMPETSPSARNTRPVLRSGRRSPRNEPSQFACPRCHRVVERLLHVSLSNVVSYLEWSVCGGCVDELRGLASDLELVEVLA